MKKLILVLTAIAITAGAYAQTDSTNKKMSPQDNMNTNQSQEVQNYPDYNLQPDAKKQKDAKDVAEKPNDAEFNANKQEKDAQFLVNAAEINLEQIELGKLAQEFGRTTHVKELGKMMEDAHTKSLKDLTALANSKMITIPTSPTGDSKDAYKTLNGKSGNDFDKAYTDMMISSHKDAIEAYEKASTDSYNTDIKNWATVALPGLRTHLESSIDCQNKCDKM